MTVLLKYLTMKNKELSSLWSIWSYQKLISWHFLNAYWVPGDRIVFTDFNSLEFYEVIYNY